MAGSDQFGNITAGVELIRRTLGHRTESYGITAPLVTHSDGRKMGKSEHGAVWLSAERTSPYAFFQHWINVPDADTSAFLRWFTLFEREEVEAIEREHGAAPSERIAQRALARHMTERLHGIDECRRVEAASEALFGSGELRSLDEATLGEVFADLPHSEHDRSQLGLPGLPLLELLPATTLASSKREAREFLERGAIAVNGLRVPSDYRLTHADLLCGDLVFLRRGKRTWHGARWRTGERA
jgi:tyrosyl-tRNA synthetase